MPTVNTTIGYPIIVAPAHFEVRYRPAVSVGPPTWTALPDQTNAPFSFVVPTFGSWVLGITYVDAAGESCEEVLYPFEVTQVCECIVVTAAVVQRDKAGGPVYLNITYTNPIDPPCGVVIQYIPDYLPAGLSTPATVRINPMPATPIKIPVQALIPHRVEVFTDCCDGRLQSCFQGVLPASPDPVVTCVGIDNINTQVRIVKSSSTGTYYLEFTFPGPPTAPVPAMCFQMYFAANQITLSASQRKDSLTGLLPIPAFYNYAANGFQTMYPINPNTNVDYLGIRYTVVLHDCCGNTFTFPSVVFSGVQIP